MADDFNILDTPTGGGGGSGLPFMPLQRGASVTGISNALAYRFSDSVVNDSDVAVNYLYCMPFYLPLDINLTGLVIDLAVAGGFGVTIRAGVYSVNTTTGEPDTLLAQTSDINNSSGVQITNVLSSLDLTAGAYYTALACTSLTPDFVVDDGYTGSWVGVADSATGVSGDLSTGGAIRSFIGSWSVLPSNPTSFSPDNDHLFMVNMLGTAI